MSETDEWPPEKARSMEDWKAYWSRQRWDRRFRHNYLNPWWHRVMRKAKAPRKWFYAAKAFIHRGRHGWAVPDTWGLDDYLCQVVGEAVAYLNKVKHGHPCDSTEQDWDETLAKISGPLLAYKTHWVCPDGQATDEHRALEEKLISEAQDAFRLLAEWLPSLWD